MKYLQKAEQLNPTCCLIVILTILTVYIWHLRSSVHAMKEWSEDKTIDRVPFYRILNGDYYHDSAWVEEEDEEDVDWESILRYLNFKNCFPPLTLSQMSEKYPELVEKYSGYWSGMTPEDVRAFYLNNLPMCVKEETWVPVCVRAKIAAKAREVDRQFSRLISRPWHRYSAVGSDTWSHWTVYYEVSLSGMTMRQMFNRYATPNIEQSCKARNLAIMDCPEACDEVLSVSIRTNEVMDTVNAPHHQHANHGHDISAHLPVEETSEQQEVDQEQHELRRAI